MNEDIETISADVLRDIIARGEAARYISEVGAMVKIFRLARAMRKAEREYLAAFDPAVEIDGTVIRRAAKRYKATYDALITALDELADNEGDELARLRRAAARARLQETAADLDAAENLTDYGEI